MNLSNTPRILRIDASARQGDSVSRGLADDLMERLKGRYPQAQVTHRDLSLGLPLIDQEWIDASFTDPADHSAEQKQRLALSEQLLAELENSDILVLATPIYNFSIPAVLKAWVDQVVRAGRSFRYTEQGPVGLLADRSVYLVMATGGTRIGSDMDFATPYLRHVLGFMGITDVRLVAADQLNIPGTESVARAQREIAELLPETSTEAA